MLLYYFITKLNRVLLITVIAYITILAGCKSKEVAAPREGVIFSPLTAYQEAYPGSLLSFKFRIASPQPVTGFSLRVKLPDAADFVALPQYPDLDATAAAAFTGFTNFEYAVPGYETPVDKQIQFKFIATTAARTYEEVYTVRLVNKGLQNIKLYGTESANYFYFPAIDLAQGAGVTATSESFTKDLVPVLVTARDNISGVTFKLIEGFTSANGAKFKPITAAAYNAAPSTYAAAYNAVPAASEYTALSGLITTASGGRGPLVLNNYYMAKISRNNVFSYVAMQAKRVPASNVNVVGAITTFDVTADYVQLEIKK